jgi:dTDP-4-amino-4,6-dideoxygalactose transaminase
MYYVLLRDGTQRARLIDDLSGLGVNAVFHYVPLHSSPAGLRYGRVSGGLPVTDDIASRLLRLPLWAGMEPDDVDAVIDGLEQSVPRASTESKGVLTPRPSEV